MRCIIIGGGGFLGSHLSDALLAARHEVRIFDRPEARYLEYSRRQGSIIFTGDFLNPDNLSLAISNCDVVFHLASTTVPQTSNDNPRYDIETNILGTLQLLDEMRKIQINKIVFASSGGTVYGIPQEIPIKENHSTEPMSSYGISKLAIEKYLHLYQTLYGLNYCVLRIANAYGERQPITETQGVISAFVEKAIHHGEIIVWGDGSVIRDYIYAGDIAQAFLKASIYDGEPKIFNIGGGKGSSVSDIINIIETLAREPLQIKYLPARPIDVPLNVLDISHAKMHLGWQPTVGLQEGISRAFNWMALNIRATQPD